jgi:hypothetical protein
MTIRSVDLQVVVQKASEVMRNRQNEDSKTRIQLQQQAQQLHHKEHIDSRQVKMMQKPGRTAINEKENRGKNNEQRQKKGTTKKGQKQRTKDGTSTIDIKI